MKNLLRKKQEYNYITDCEGSVVKNKTYTINKIYKNLRFKEIKYQKDKSKEIYKMEIRKRYTNNYMLDINLMKKDLYEIRYQIKMNNEIKNRNLSIHYPALTFYGGAIVGFLAGVFSSYNKEAIDFQHVCALYVIVVMIIMAIIVNGCTKRDNKMIQVLEFYETLEQLIMDLLKDYKL